MTNCSDGVWEAMGPQRRPRTAAQWTNASRAFAWGYEPIWRSQSMRLLTRGKVTDDDERAALVDWAGRVARDRPVLDLGCATGRYSRALVAHGHSVLAVDHARPCLDAIARSCGDGALGVRTLAQRLPFADGSLAGVAVGGSLNEIGDIDAALREANRVTAPGGSILSMSLVSASTTAGRVVQRSVGTSGIVFPSLDATVASFENAGWRLTADVRRVGPVVWVEATTE